MVMATKLEVLKLARYLLSDFSHWTQGAKAKTANGETCPPEDDGAYMFCAVGAPSRANHILGCQIDVSGPLYRVAERLYGKGPISVNDDGWCDPKDAYQHVLKLYDTAIEEQANIEKEQQALQDKILLGSGFDYACSNAITTA
jgi:hypothetical protein